MRIYIHDLGDGTFQLAINDHISCEDYAPKTWVEVIEILSSLKPPKR